MGITCCCSISPRNILIDPFGVAKLYGYGLYYITEMGAAVSFPIGSAYSAPEILVSCPVGGATAEEVTSSAAAAAPAEAVTGSVSNCTADCWSLGCVLLQLLLLNKHKQEDAAVEEGAVSLNVKTVLELVAEGRHEDLVSGLLDVHPELTHVYQGLKASTRELLNQCLQFSPVSRATPSQLLQHPAFSELSLSGSVEARYPRFPLHMLPPPRPPFPHSSAMLPGYPLPADMALHSGEVRVRGLRERNIKEVYHLWQLAGGQTEQELSKHGLIHTYPPILTLPSMAVVEGEVFGGQFHHLHQQQPSQATLALSLKALCSHLAHIPYCKYYPFITQKESDAEDVEARKLPLVIRERDVEHQFHRIILYHRLLRAYPYQRDRIVIEAGQDITPYWRGLVWAALLGVDGDVQDSYAQIDKVTPTSTDRQIEVDIPRCHQYDELLSSPLAHVKFMRLLKAWVVSHPGLVYWQGLDSLTAPFLYLNFNNEALAYACLSAFIAKYLHKFFLRDNSAVIQEYLAKFSQLIAFHDPLLYSHLSGIGFVPELYAIPWFLTMYTHVFPLSQIFHVWDTLLLYPASLALCVATAILRHLRHQLLTYSFNDCILLFSDMPDINIEQIVSESVLLHKQTPESLTYRHHAPHHHRRCSDTADELGLEPATMALLSAMDDMTLAEVRNEVCARISAADLIAATTRRGRNTELAVLIIDTRPPHMYQSGSLVGAWNIPGDAWLSGGGNDSNGGSPAGGSCEEATGPPYVREIKERAKDKIVVVMGARAAHHITLQVCEELVQEGVPRVCSLHGGVDVFQATGQLVVASPTAT
uniref:TBC domain-containing protein kinase-like protein n=2 Tax=Hirondellea gigas TaxID=1518452 RepID=A0A6A7FNK6_9CRUS